MPSLSGPTPRHPTHINLPPPFFSSVSLSPSPSHRLEDPFASPLISPALTFYTAPSSPIVSPLVDEPPETSQAMVCDPPPQNVAIVVPSAQHAMGPTQQPFPPVPQTDDTFPEVSGLDLALDDEGPELNPLEKIYLYSVSKATYHRVFISRDLPNLLDQIAPQEAVEYVLPLLQVLSKDQDESVREALTSGLASVIWWFLTHCQVVATMDNQINSYPTSISVHAFTPILGRLLLSPNGLVGSSAKCVVVNLLQRIREADGLEDMMQETENRQAKLGIPIPGIRVSPQSDDWVADSSFVPKASLNEDLTIGLFRKNERVLFEQEILWDLVAGLDRLILDGDSDLLPDQSPRSDSTSFSDPFSDSVGRQTDEQITSLHPLQDRSHSPIRSPDLPLPTNYQTSTLLPASNGTPNSDVVLPYSTGYIYNDGSSQAGSMSDDGGDHCNENQEQKAVKRLTSMSLMAIVTSTGYVDEQTQNAFVKEVEHVVMDSIYWVRRESSFVLGALAKVVPDEVVHTSLLPLLERLLIDPAPLVRHSSLFALPVILARLPVKHRRALAVHTMQSMSADESPDVRSGVLEALGEVIHTFHDEYRKPGDDTEGPPAELISMFIGQRDDKKVWDGQQPALTQPFDRDKMRWLDSFYNDPCRPLICAFNLPAVAMTLGVSRWETLRETYLKLSNSPAFGVRRTLAASVGDMAKVLGPEIAQRDLMSVWWDGLRSQEAEIRLKIVQSLETFVGSLNVGGKTEVLEGVLEAWKENRWSCWREREHIAGCLSAVIQSVASQGDQEVVYLLRLVCGLLRFALIDNVNAIREAGIHTLPLIWPMLQRHPKVLGDLHLDLQGLSSSSVFRQRMTYIACQQVLLLPDGDMEAVKVPDEELWTTLRELSKDSIVGVRIGVSRLIAGLYGKVLLPLREAICHQILLQHPVGRGRCRLSL
ncbi:armadillo-type protein [Desarmillaria tabescens]|uniref:Armadillo-type protein n=1 Tax=Armillaria tabescens TaxID=1929756 RepID=A0AA39N6Z9_ARMTA|nr:armadillo-type protein [Desarmillaria tabescens]KAK0459620.1 armadillo-type protein [Desarmillaria tabescens]